MNYSRWITTETIVPTGEALFTEGATEVTMDDEACGAYVKVTQHPDAESAATVSFDTDEWPTVRQVIDDMVHRAERYTRSLKEDKQ